MSVRRVGWLAILVGFIVLALPAPALAYLDPGTGSMVFQMAAAAIFAAMLTVKLYWNRVKTFVKGVFRKTADAGRDGR
jgi:hypothetical protein